MDVYFRLKVAEPIETLFLGHVEMDRIVTPVMRNDLTIHITTRQPKGQKIVSSTARKLSLEADDELSTGAAMWDISANGAHFSVRSIQSNTFLRLERGNDSAQIA
jgi:hypothetical protein